MSRAGDGSPLRPTGLRQGNWADGAGRGTEARGRAQPDPGVGLEYPGLSRGVGGRGTGGVGQSGRSHEQGLGVDLHDRAGLHEQVRTLRWG